MKRLCLILLTAIAVTSCKKESVSPGFDESLNAWNDFKTSARNSYTYIAYSGSWTGYHAETKVTVSNGKVSGREFKSGYYKQNSDTILVQVQWAESGATLNTHDNGHDGLTIDQWYTRARREWFTVDKNANDIYFEADNNGILSLAGYVPKNCADDCFRGIKIKDIRVYVKEIK